MAETATLALVAILVVEPTPPDLPSVDPPTEPPVQEDPEAEEPFEDEEAFEDEEPPPPDTEPTSSPAPPPVQRPSPTPQRPASPPPAGDRQPAAPKEPSPMPRGEKKPSPMPRGESSSQGETPEPEAEKKGEERWRKIKFFRLGLWPRLGYAHGTSQNNGIFDRDRTIEHVSEGGQGPVGADDLADTQFGGGMGGAELDLEIFLINVWLDFHKFFTPGGMLSLLVGYDHEFWLHRVVRLDVGLGFGFMRVFLGGPLEKLYYDADNVESTNVANAGIEGRLFTNLRFRIWKPLYTGPQFSLGYHYLFTANTEEVTKERGLHYAVAWTFGFEFALPKD
jgi:hypothetical protein